MSYCVVKLFGVQPAHNRFWRLGTMTCIRLDIHLKHPQLILLTRIFLIISFFLLRFTCFILGALCSTRFQSQCTTYTVFAAFALISFLLIILVEFIHFVRLWTYNPTDPRNTNEKYTSTTVSSDKFIEKSHRRHLGFIHHSMVNDQNAFGFRQSLCPKGDECQSESLHHQLICHSLEYSCRFSNLFSNRCYQTSITAFYKTTSKNAFQIVEYGFPCENNLQLQRDIYFTPSVSSNIEPNHAIICARINLGQLSKIKAGPLDLDQYFERAGYSCDTVYIENLARFYLRMPGQIEKWVVMISSGTTISDELDSNYY
ncbi:unnamed protein product, partial [Rotaria sp. Silwood1]